MRYLVLAPDYLEIGKKDGCKIKIDKSDVNVENWSILEIRADSEEDLGYLVKESIKSISSLKIKSIRITGNPDTLIEKLMNILENKIMSIG